MQVQMRTLTIHTFRLLVKRLLLCEFFIFVQNGVYYVLYLYMEKEVTITKVKDGGDNGDKTVVKMYKRKSV